MPKTKFLISQLSVSDRIKELMPKLGLNKKQFANEIEVSPSNVSDWFSGRALPSIKVLVRMYQTFRVNLNWLLTGEGSIFIESELTNVIGNRIKSIRENLKLKIDEFIVDMKDFNISKEDYIEIEKGGKEVPPQLLLYLAIVYGISEEWIRKGTGNMKVKSPSHEAYNLLKKQELEKELAETQFINLTSEIDSLDKQLESENLSEEEIKLLKKILNGLKEKSSSIKLKKI